MTRKLNIIRPAGASPARSVEVASTASGNGREMSTIAQPSAPASESSNASGNPVRAVLNIQRTPDQQRYVVELKKGSPVATVLKLGAWAAGPPQALTESMSSSAEPVKEERKKITIVRKKDQDKPRRLLTAADAPTGPVRKSRDVSSMEKAIKNATSRNDRAQADRQKKKDQRKANKNDQKHRTKISVMNSHWTKKDESLKNGESARTRRNREFQKRTEVIRDKGRRRAAEKKELEKLNLSERGQGKTRPRLTASARRAAQHKRNLNEFYNIMVLRKKPHMTEHQAVQVAANLIRFLYVALSDKPNADKFADKLPHAVYNKWAQEKFDRLPENMKKADPSRGQFFLALYEVIVKLLKEGDPSMLTAEQHALKPMLGAAYAKRMFDFKSELNALLRKPQSERSQNDSRRIDLIKLLLQMQGIEPNPGPFDANFKPRGLANNKKAPSISSMLRAIDGPTAYFQLFEFVRYLPEFCSGVTMPTPVLLSMTISEDMHAQLYAVLLTITGQNGLSKNQYNKFKKRHPIHVDPRDCETQTKTYNDSISMDMSYLTQFQRGGLITTFELQMFAVGLNPYSVVDTPACMKVVKSAQLEYNKISSILDLFSLDPEIAFESCKPWDKWATPVPPKEEEAPSSEKDDGGEPIPGPSPELEEEDIASMIALQPPAPGGTSSHPKLECSEPQSVDAKTPSEAKSDEPKPPASSPSPSPERCDEPVEVCSPVPVREDEVPLVEIVTPGAMLTGGGPVREGPLLPPDDYSPHLEVDPPLDIMPGEPLDKEVYFKGRFAGLDSSFNDEDPIVHVKVRGEIWSHDADGTVKSVRVTRRMTELGARAAPSSDRNVRFANTYQLLGQDNKLADQMENWSRPEVVEFMRSKIMIAFLMTGVLYSSGDLKVLPVVDAMRTIRYQCPPVSDEIRRHVDKYARVASDLSSNLKAELGSCRLAPLWLEGFTTYQPSIASVNNIYAFLYKRILAPALPVEGYVLARLSQLADSLSLAIITRIQQLAVPDKEALFEHAVHNRPQYLREEFREGFDCYMDDPSGTTNSYCKQIYNGFYKNELSAFDSGKPPRGIFCLKPKFRGVQVAAMCRILWKVEQGTRSCNVKGLTPSQVMNKLIDRFSSEGDAYETDFTSFESCEQWIIRHNCEVRVFTALAETEDERNFIRDAIDRKYVSILGKGYDIPHQPHIRMSGDYWTSLGNLITNIIVMAYVNNKDIDWVLDHCMGEGDDGMMPVVTKQEIIEQRAVECGMRLKLKRGPWHQLSFCGNHFEEQNGELVLVRDADKMICQTNTIFDANPATRSGDYRLERAKVICQLDGPWVGRSCAWAAVVERATQQYTVTLDYLIKYDLLREYSPYKPESCLPEWLRTESDDVWALRVWQHERACGAPTSLRAIKRMLSEARDIVANNKFNTPVHSPWAPPPGMPAVEFQEGLRRRYFRHALGFIPMRVDHSGQLGRVCSPFATVSEGSHTVRAGFGPLGRFIGRYKYPVAIAALTALAYSAVTGKPAYTPILAGAVAVRNVISATAQTLSFIPRLVTGTAKLIASNIYRAMVPSPAPLHERVAKAVVGCTQLVKVVTRSASTLFDVATSASEELHKAAMAAGVMVRRAGDVRAVVSPILEMINSSNSNLPAYRPYWDPLGHYG